MNHIIIDLNIGRNIIGTTLSILITILAIIKKRPILLLVALVQGYGFAWVGHFIFEKK